ncbi:MAG: AbrB/MazE/SpoVT family DNA-binding domain-containing protein [Halobacteria archaeon]
MLSLPKRLGEALGLQGGDKVRWEVGPGRSLLLRPVKDGDGQRENVRGA